MTIAMCWGATVWCGYTWRCSVVASCWGRVKREGRENRLSLLPDLRPECAIFASDRWRWFLWRCCVVSFVVVAKHHPLALLPSLSFIHVNDKRHHDVDEDCDRVTRRPVEKDLAGHSPISFHKGCSHPCLAKQFALFPTPNYSSFLPNYSSSSYLLHWSRYSTRIKTFIFSRYLGNILKTLRDKFSSKYATREYLLPHWTSLKLRSSGWALETCRWKSKRCIVSKTFLSKRSHVCPHFFAK